MANQVLYGFNNLLDLASDRVTTSNTPVILSAIQQATAEHERQLRAVFSLFVQSTTLHTERYRQLGVARLQPVDDNGRARPIKPSGHYDVAYPIQAGASAWGANFVTRVKMTVEEVALNVELQLEADRRWMRDHLLGQLFASTTYAFVDDLYGSLTIQPLANGDTVTYQVMAGNDTAATSTHQLAQAGAISATNPYPTIFSTLMGHPENGGKVVALIATSLKATTQALASFNPIADSNVRLGSASDVLVGSLGVPTPGTLIGYEDSGVWIVEWPFLPADYIIATTTEGPRAIAMREDPEPELRGFKLVATRDDYPFEEAQWLRRAGFGARNRVGALVYRIGNGTYAVPTNYTVPMP